MRRGCAARDSPGRAGQAIAALKPSLVRRIASYQEEESDWFVHKGSSKYMGLQPVGIVPASVRLLWIGIAAEVAAKPVAADGG